MLILITGGCKNGKSSAAEKTAYELSGGETLFYLATMIASDDEDKKRIEKHIDSRKNLLFATIEKGFDISELVTASASKEPVLPTSATVLLDSLTALLSNEMFKTSPDGKYTFCENAAKKALNDILTVQKNVKNLVIVSDYIQSDAIMYDEFTEKYREGLSFLEKELCEIADKTVEIVAGKEVIISGRDCSDDYVRYKKADDECMEDMLNNRSYGKCMKEVNTLKHTDIRRTLIIGGAYQGKRAFAKENFGLSDADICTCTDDMSELPSGFRCYEHLERYVQACVKEGKEPSLDFINGSVLIMDDIFCGVVPMDDILRASRECAGKYLQKLAEGSDVYRVFCKRGIRL